MQLAARGLLVLITVAVYAGSLTAPFIFDDIPAIVENLTIRSLGESLSPPTDKGTSAIGRPVFNLSLALNYAFGGLQVEGYHATNLALHLCAGLLLFSLVRRTLAALSGPSAASNDAVLIAWAAALLWLLHPLQVESVTCVVQRTESLMGLFFLLTLYTFVRGAGSSRPWPWWALSIGACLLAVGTKEVAALAPPMVLLYDRAFITGSFAGAFKVRRGYYITLFATWLPLAMLMLGTKDRGQTVGFGLGMSSWTYLITQCKAVVMYLNLTIWPHPLVLDYGTETVAQLADVLPQAALLSALFLATLWALWRRPALGFVGAWFFFILAPSSSFVPLRTQTMAEHRMYLPLAALAVLAAVGMHRAAGRRGLAALAFIALGFGGLTAARNASFQHPLELWADTVALRPDNPRARYNYGQALVAAGRVDEAITQYEAALRIDPDYKEHTKLAVALAETGRLPEALEHFARALELKPDFAEARDGYGVALTRAGRLQDAVRELNAAVQLDPANALTRYNLGNALIQSDRPEEALAEFQRAVALRVDFAPAVRNLANTLLMLERPAEAVPCYEAALRLEPDNAQAKANLALARSLLPPR